MIFKYNSSHDIFQPNPVVVSVRIHLVFERDIVPENDNIFISIIGDSMRTLARDSDALPLGASVVDSIQSNNRSALEDVVEHGSCVLVIRLHLTRSESDQTSPGVTQVSAVPPGQLVLLILHLETQVVPGDPLLARLSVIWLHNLPVELFPALVHLVSLVELSVAAVVVRKLWIRPLLIILDLFDDLWRRSTTLWGSHGRYR